MYLQLKPFPAAIRTVTIKEGAVVKSNAKMLKCVCSHNPKPQSNFQVLILPLIFECSLQNRDTAGNGWNFPLWNGATLQNPQTSSGDFDGIYVTTGLFSTIWHLQLLQCPLCHFGYLIINTTLCAIYLMAIENQGGSQFIHKSSDIVGVSSALQVNISNQCCYPHSLHCC